MRDPIGTMQGMCAKSVTRRPQLTRRAPQRALENRNLKCRVSSASLGANLLTVLLVLDSDKRNGGNSDLVHSRRLLIHHRPVDCGVKNRPDGIRLGPNPGSPAQPCQPFNTSHTIRASRTSWSFCLCLPFQASPVDSHVRAGPHPAKFKSLAASNLTPCVSSKKLSRSTWLRISEPRASPQIVNGPGCRRRPQSIPNPFRLCVQLRCSPPSSCAACTSTPESMTHCFNLLCQPSCIALQHPA